MFYFTQKSPFIVAIMSGLVLCGTSPGISYLFAFEMLHTGFGTKKNQPISIFAGVVFENVITLTLFQLFQNVVLS